MAHKNAVKGANFERKVAGDILGHRFLANSGDFVDVESHELVVQCKKVKLLPLSQLTDLVEQIDRVVASPTIGLDGVCRSEKVGVVAVQLVRPSGFTSPILYVFSAAQYKKLRNLHNLPEITEEL